MWVTRSPEGDGIMRIYNKKQWAGLIARQRVRVAPKGILCLFLLAAVFVPVVTADSAQPSATTVTITTDGSSWEYATSQKTVGSLLKEAGIALNAKDRVNPQTSTKLVQGMQVRVVRVEEKIVVAKEPIQFKKETRLDFRGSAGRAIMQKGVPGEKEIKYLVTYKDGVKSASKVMSSKVTKKPVKEITAISRGSFLASRSGSYTRSFSMVATAYDPYNCGGSGSGRTASGMMAGKGVVAVDPRVIRLGTKLYVEGYGFCVAGDTGGAIKGARIDLGFNSYREALRFGRRRVTVYVLE